MTIYDKGLIRAMKQAYRDDGYYVASTESSIIIQTDTWGAEIITGAVPNSIKSLITLHNGGMPHIGTAVNVSKSECGSAFLETVTGIWEDLAKRYTMGSVSIKPTRLTFDGLRVWQTTTDLKLRLVNVEDQQILAGEKWDASLISGYIYGKQWFGAMYVRTQMVVPEDKPLIEHLSQMQWIPVELE